MQITWLINVFCASMYSKGWIHNFTHSREIAYSFLIMSLRQNDPIFNLGMFLVSKNNGSFMLLMT